MVAGCDGRGLGHEQVTVDGAVRCVYSQVWFTPRFEFEVGGRPGGGEVRVWPWLLLRSLVLRIDDVVVFAERAGVEIRAKSKLADDWWDRA